jgi:hypothetical protein
MSKDRLDTAATVIAGALLGCVALTAGPGVPGPSSVRPNDAPAMIELSAGYIVIRPTEPIVTS